MKDTGFKSKTSKTETIKENGFSEPKVSQPKPASRAHEKVKITKVFQFAGEEVEVEKEVPADSAEARLTLQPSSSEAPKINNARRGLGGIGSVLNQLGKKPKISTLEKTKLDWDRYKKEENIEDELAAYNKGKDGYVKYFAVCLLGG